MNHSNSTPYFPANLEDYAPWVAEHGLYAPYGKCQCLCGEKTSIAPRNRKSRGWTKGEPQPFVSGHSARRRLKERFWKNVDKRGPNDCWEWQGRKLPWGYGESCIDGNSMAAHRVAWILTHGSIPDGMFVCHHCDNPPCCNPVHLFMGTPLDNSRDMVRKNRSVRGERNGQAKLTENQVIEIRELHKEGMTQAAIARQHRISPTTIHHIVRRKKWKHVK